MKTFKDFRENIIKYIGSVPHTVFPNKGAPRTLPRDRAMAKRSSSSAGGGSASTGDSGGSGDGSD